MEQFLLLNYYLHDLHHYNQQFDINLVINAWIADSLVIEILSGSFSQKPLGVQK